VDDYGIPFITVTGSQPLVAIGPDPNFDYLDESDPGPYPIPPNAPDRRGASSTGDRHVLVPETTNCVLTSSTTPLRSVAARAGPPAPQPNGRSRSNALRTDGWTSADAAGCAIFPGLVRYEEALAGEIAHAIRFTAVNIWGSEAGNPKYLWPARHWSGSKTSFTYPPMGARFRLKASFNIPSTFHPMTQTILRAFKKYGMVLADGGSNWYFSGASNPSWPDPVFTELKSIAGSNFEAVDTALLQVDPNSAQSKQNVNGNPPRSINISTRGQVQTGFDVMIAGFVISGSAPKTVVITGKGAVADPLRHSQCACESHAHARALLRPGGYRDQRRLGHGGERGAAAGERLRAVQRARIRAVGDPFAGTLHGDHPGRGGGTAWGLPKSTKSIAPTCRSSTSPRAARCLPIRT
jgi:hypothetical protein